jgi:hypothetical protein
MRTLNPRIRLITDFDISKLLSLFIFYIVKGKEQVIRAAPVRFQPTSRPVPASLPGRFTRRKPLRFNDLADLGSIAHYHTSTYPPRCQLSSLGDTCVCGICICFFFFFFFFYYSNYSIHYSHRHQKGTPGYEAEGCPPPYRATTPFSLSPCSC